MDMDITKLPKHDLSSLISALAVFNKTATFNKANLIDALSLNEEKVSVDPVLLALFDLSKPSQNCTISEFIEHLKLHFSIYETMNYYEMVDIINSVNFTVLKFKKDTVIHFEEMLDQVEHKRMNSENPYR